MATKDVLDQIRDLQSFIDDFAIDAGTTSPTAVSLGEKTELVLAEPLTKETILQKPDEKTEVIEEAVKEKKMEVVENTVEEKAAVVVEVKSDEKTAEVIEEKILVESQQPKQPLSILSYDLNLSDDFSSLLTQFKEIKVSPIDMKMLQKQSFMDIEKNDKEKIQVDIAPANIDNTVISAADSHVISATTPKFNTSFLLNDLPTNSNTASTRSQSRCTSVSSKKSQRSVKSARSARSARRLQNEKKLQQQHKQQQQQQSQKYVERSYDEMMRIPDIYERLAFYEKTLDLCLKAESPISNWCKSNKEKGKPQPLLEGYVPPIRLLSPEVPLSENTFGNMSSTFSGSISMFLKKAGSQAIPKRNVLENKSFLVSSSSYTAHTPSNYSNSSSGIFGRSISRLNLSRSTQVPRYDNPIKTPAATRLAPLYQNRVASTLSTTPGTPVATKKRSSVNTMNKALSPLNMDYKNKSNNNSSSNLVRTPKSSSSTPNSFGSTTTINSQGEFTSQSSALNYMVNVLPQIDLRILQNALDEAKGDPMVAISIAVSHSKISNYHHDVRTSKKSSSRHYKVK